MEKGYYVDEKDNYIVNGEYRKGSVDALLECIDLQLKKANDYQNPNSTVQQSDYYPRGVETIYDQIWGKLLRIRSLLDACDDGESAPNFESIEDSFKDLINYASFAVSYTRGQMEGQKPHKDMFNRVEDIGPLINQEPEKQGSCCGGGCNE